MILVTGATGFIGRHLIQQLAASGRPVRVLLRPSAGTPNLPRGLAFESTIASLGDERGLRAALSGVKTVYHLAGGEWRGAYASLMQIDIQGTQNVVRAAVDAGVERILYVSHLGADRASAYPVLKAKAIAEEVIRRSGLDFTILRAAILFGPGDGLTTGLAWLTYASPFILLPGDGSSLLQPLGVEDLAACLAWALDDPETRGQTFEIGGAEYLTFRQVVHEIQEALGRRRPILPFSIPYLRALTVFLESAFPEVPLSVYWLDYLAAHRTCALDTLPRAFHLMPARFSAAQLAYLRQVDWRRQVWQVLRARRPRRRPPAAEPF
jgi:NADH dehydrogenase